MKQAKRKNLLILLLTLLLIAADILIIAGYNATVLRHRYPSSGASQTEALDRTAEEIGTVWKETEATIEELIRVNAELKNSVRHSGREEEDNQKADRTALIESNVNFRAMMLKPEAVCGGYAMLVMEDPASETGYHIIDRNDQIPGYAELKKTGLTWETFGQMTAAEKSSLKLNGSAFEVMLREIPEMNGFLIMLTPKENLFFKAISRSTYTIALTILLMYGIAVADSSLCSYIRKNILSPDQEQRYHPRSIRRFAVFFGVLGIILIAVCGWLDQSLNSLYDFSVRSRNVLTAAEKNIEMGVEQDNRETQDVEKIYLAYGSTIAEILHDHPETRSGEILRSFAETIGADFITLYNAQGKETACSGDYIDLELGRDPLSTTWEFRRILKGSPSVFREAETDEETGLNEARLGIRISDVEEEGKYGAMIIALDPALFEHDIAEEVNTILGDMTISGTRLWISDLKTGQVLAASDRNLIGKDAQDLGLRETDLKDAVMRELRTNAGTCYLASSALGKRGAEESESGEGRIVFYSEDPDASSFSVSSIIVSCIAFVLLSAILQTVALSDYTEEFWNTYKHVGVQAGPVPAENSFEEGNGDKISTLEAIRKSVADAWAALTPGRKGLLAVEVVAVVFLLDQIPLTSLIKEYAKDTVYYHITTGEWSRGWNLFALAAIVNLAAEILLGVILTRILLKGLAFFSGTKGKTICRLLSSFVRYFGLFAFLILGASYLGVDKATILTGVGAVSLALSLGAQDLISDVIAGVSIVFEGTFHVGEIVKIAGSTGSVLEIGIRSTKILDGGGDIVAVSNRKIDQIVNKTQHSSWYACEFIVSSSLAIEELEKLLKEELPKIAAGDPRILSGPSYVGITELGGITMTLSILTECELEDYEYVRQKVNRELQRLFREKGILL